LDGEGEVTGGGRFGDEFTDISEVEGDFTWGGGGGGGRGFKCVVGDGYDGDFEGRSGGK
jgi:hypothetical protein